MKHISNKKRFAKDVNRIRKSVVTFLDLIEDKPLRKNFASFIKRMPNVRNALDRLIGEPYDLNDISTRMDKDRIHICYKVSDSYTPNIRLVKLMNIIYGSSTMTMNPIVGHTSYKITLSRDLKRVSRTKFVRLKIEGQTIDNFYMEGIYNKHFKPETFFEVPKVEPTKIENKTDLINSSDIIAGITNIKNEIDSIDLQIAEMNKRRNVLQKEIVKISKIIKEYI